MNSLRVLQVVDSLGMGGAETWLMALLRHWLKTAAPRIDFLISSGKPGIFDDEARRLGAKIHYLHYRRARLPQFASEAFYVAELEKVTKELQILSLKSQIKTISDQLRKAEKSAPDGQVEQLQESLSRFIALLNSSADKKSSQ